MRDRQADVRIILALLALCLLVVEASASNFLINSYRYGGVSLSFEGCDADAANQTTYSYASQSIGEAAADRFVLVVAMAEDTGAVNFSASSMDIAGSAGTEIVDSAQTDRSKQVAIYGRTVTSGTTATIEITWSEAITSSTICIYAAYGLDSTTATDTTVGESEGDEVTLDINVSEGGIIVGGCINGDSGEGGLFSGITTQESGEVPSEAAWITGSTSSAAAATPRSVSCNHTSALETVGATASFR